MKTLTLWQPYATLIALGAKRFETRGWCTNYRGPIAIHAGAKLVRDEELDGIVRSAGGSLPVPRGAVVAIADLVGCPVMTEAMIEAQSALELSVGDWHPGRFAWQLANVRQVVPEIPAKGAQGVWEWPVERDEIARWL